MKLNESYKKTYRVSLKFKQVMDWKMSKDGKSLVFNHYFVDYLSI